MYSEYGSIDELDHEQREQLAALNRQMIQGVDALWNEIKKAGQAAGLDGDLVLDHVTGWLQVAVDNGQRLDYYLKHKQAK